MTLKQWQRVVSRQGSYLSIKKKKKINEIKFFLLTFGQHFLPKGKIRHEQSGVIIGSHFTVSS